MEKRKTILVTEWKRKLSLDINGRAKKWRDQKWVRIGTDGKIKGPCGTSKDKNPDRCLPLAKARSLSKRQRAATARKKKASGGRKQFVANTPAAKVKSRG